MMKPIWYVAAVNGEAPPNNWPVIIPGIETTPTTAIILRLGVKACRRALRILGNIDSYEVAPNANLVSHSYALSDTSDNIFSIARLGPDIEFPISIPQHGIKICGSQYGFGLKTIIVPITPINKPPQSTPLNASWNWDS